MEIPSTEVEFASIVAQDCFDRVMECAAAAETAEAGVDEAALDLTRACMDAGRALIALGQELGL